MRGHRVHCLGRAVDAPSHGTVIRRVTIRIVPACLFVKRTPARVMVSPGGRQRWPTPPPAKCVLQSLQTVGAAIGADSCNAGHAASRDCAESLRSFIDGAAT